MTDASAICMIGKKPGKKTDTDPNSSRDRILSAAIELFYEQGYDGTTTRQIIKRADVFNGSLYHFFSGKDDIFKTIILDELRVALKKSEDLVDDSTDYVVALIFPLAVELYTAGRSQRIASLLYHAHKSWSIVDGFVDIFTDWIHRHVPDADKEIDDRKFYVDVLSVLGAVGNLVGEFCNGVTKIDYRDSLGTVVGLAHSMFNRTSADTDRIVKSLSNIIENENLSIGGYFVKKNIHEL